MSALWNLNLIRFLDFYYMLMFLVGIWRRWGQYRQMAGLVFSGPGRWPLLLKLIKEHRTVLLTWNTILPAAFALLLLLAQLLASRIVWPQAGYPPNELTPARLLPLWYLLPIFIGLAGGVIGIDIYLLRQVASLDRQQLEKYFDLAEYWLGSKTSHVVRVVTLGFINPHKLVSAEVKKALVMAGGVLNSTFWWMAVQMGLRFCFGLSLWLTWAFFR